MASGKGLKTVLFVFVGLVMLCLDFIAGKQLSKINPLERIMLQAGEIIGKESYWCSTYL